jgi:segregation and condensation protein B
MFRTAPDLSFLLRKEVEEQRRLSRAGTETLAIIAYHQPVTRAEIEELRGVGLSKGTLDVLMEAGWVRPKGRRRTPGRPVTYGTSDEFLVHFGLESVEDLPGLEELKAAGLLERIEVALNRMEREAAKAAEITAKEKELAEAQLELDTEPDDHPEDERVEESADADIQDDDAREDDIQAESPREAVSE